MAIKGTAYVSSALCVPKPKINPRNQKEENKKKLQQAKKQRECIRRSFEKEAESLTNLLSDIYNQSSELEADKFGMEIAYESGFNPKAAIDLQQIFLRVKVGAEHQKKSCFARAFDLMSSHPPSEQRLKTSTEKGKSRSSS